MSYTKDERKELLKLARNSIEFYLENGEKFRIEKCENKKFLEERAVFVTLTKSSSLRGCIGQMIATETLYEAVINSGFSAAFRDPRFMKVAKEELNEIKIEISILSPMKKIKDISEIKMKRDGVFIKKGLNQGVFLPQVAEETGWDKETFLKNLCASKAGLPPESYKSDFVEIYIFQVEKFSE